ncbi:hypothetical protein [Vreelandella lionensis]|uniref:hypothetical protein n=1 Tax=Vreelandella lionensis TaxID=1144478 RepID=UPI0009F363DF|nr:hypothetical protein [Halomonas lionensis]
MNGGAGGAIVPFADTATADFNITNKVVFLADTAGSGSIATVDTAAEIAALIDGAGDAFSITAGGKGIVMAGENTGASNGFAYFVNDANSDGDVSDTGEVTQVGIVGTLDLDALTTANFAIA